MSTQLAATSIDPDQLDLLSCIVDASTPLGSLHRADFGAACRAVAYPGGWVHPSRVSWLLHDKFGEVNPRWLSGMWASGCSGKGFMDKTEVPEPIDPEFSRGNGAKDVCLRRLRSAT